MLDDDVLSLDVAERPESVQEGLQERACRLASLVRGSRFAIPFIGCAALRRGRIRAPVLAKRNGERSLDHRIRAQQSRWDPQEKYCLRHRFQDRCNMSRAILKPRGGGTHFHSWMVRNWLGQSTWQSF